MKYAGIFNELETEYPERKPGSPGFKEVITVLDKTLGALGLKTVLRKIPVFYFDISLSVLIIADLILVSWSYFHPLAGFLIAILLYLLFLKEIIRPTLARVQAVPAENLAVTVPARSKEIQKIILATTIGTDSFFKRPAQLLKRVYLIIIYSLGLDVVVCLGLNHLLQLKLFLLIAFGSILGLIYLKISARCPDPRPGLNNCAVLMELAQILAKDRPFRTTVILLFHASNSLNSGMLKIPEMIDPKLSFNYVVDILNLPDKRNKIVTADGAFLPMKGDPLLAELLTEVAREKNIPIQEIRVDRITAAYPLHFKKIKTITISNPPDQDPETGSGKDLKELLIGLIRKLD